MNLLIFYVFIIFYIESLRTFTYYISKTTVIIFLDLSLKKMRFNKQTSKAEFSFDNIFPPITITYCKSPYLGKICYTALCVFLCRITLVTEFSMFFKSQTFSTKHKYFPFTRFLSQNLKINFYICVIRRREKKVSCRNQRIVL